MTDYESLAELRYQIRRFQHFSEGVARATGLQPQQHQLMLTLKGLPRNIRPRVAELAERLQIKHHSAVELINRLSAGGYVRRHRGGKDQREVLLTLTPKGERILRTLSLYHRAELRRLQSPCYRCAQQLIDARKKPALPNELVVRDDVAKLFDRRWREYFSSDL